MPCNPLKVNRRFGGTYRLHFQGRIISRARNQRQSRWQTQPLFLPPTSRWFLARLILRPWRWRWKVFPKRRLTSNGLHGVISQNTVLFENVFVCKLQQLQHTLLSNNWMLKITVFWVVMPCSLVDLHQTKRSGIPVDSNLQSQRCENLKSHFLDPYSYKESRLRFCLRTWQVCRGWNHEVTAFNKENNCN
jgi:hypothetical protein